MQRLIVYQGMLCLTMLGLDQWSKAWIEQQPDWFHLVLVDGYVDVIKAHNVGVAFSMFADWDARWRTDVLLLLTSLLAVFVLYWWWKEVRQQRVASWCLMLIFAGAIGNIWDRMTLGYVVDFMDWHIGTHHWPAFNIADSCISVAVVWLLYLNLQGESEGADV